MVNHGQSPMKCHPGRLSQLELSWNLFKPKHHDTQPAFPFPMWGDMWEACQMLTGVLTVPSFNISQSSDPVEEIVEIFWGMTYSCLASRNHCVLYNGVRRWSVFLSEELRGSFNERTISSSKTITEAKFINPVEKAWGLANRRIFQNLLKVLNCLVHLSIPCLSQQTELTPPPHPLSATWWRQLCPEQRWKLREEIRNLLRQGEGRGIFILYTWKTKRSPNLGGGVRVPRPSEETRGQRLLA